MLPTGKPRRDRPKCARNLKTLAKALGLDKAMLRYQIAYLYWFARWQVHEIAEELNLSPRSVEGTLYRLKRELD